MLTDVEYAKIREVFTYVKSIFEFVDDHTFWDKLDMWEDPKYVVPELEAQRIVGNCDNFANACRHLLNCSKIQNRIAYCLTEDDEPHLVCEVEGWVLDNRQPRVRSWGELPYKWIRISGYRVGDHWHEIAV